MPHFLQAEPADQRVFTPCSAALGTSTRRRRGGRLRVGMVGAGKGESFDPSLAANALINTAMSCAVFDDSVATDVTKAVFEAQATRAARRLSTLTVPNRPRGVVGVYDVTDDWTPIYDKTNLPGYYVAIGTSGNQFKNAPLVGGFLRTIIDQTENGVDHDRHPAVFKAPCTGHTIELSAFSRLRPKNDRNSGTVLG